jgi:hypothetical protein
MLRTLFPPCQRSHVDFVDSMFIQLFPQKSGKISQKPIMFRISDLLHSKLAAIMTTVMWIRASDFF